jgi:hypothetical protein
MIQESTICCAQDCETCDNTATTISTNYIQSLLGKHSTVPAQCNPESIIASNRFCKRTTAPCIMSYIYGYTTLNQLTWIALLQYISKKLCSVLVMTIWQFSVVTTVWAYCITYIQTHYICSIAMICVLLCSSRVRNRLVQLPQYLPDMMYAVLPGGNMRERGILLPIPYIPQSIFGAAWFVIVADLYRGVMVESMQDIHNSFTSALMLSEVIVVYMRYSEAPNVTVYKRVVTALSICTLVYMMLYCAQKTIAVTNWRSDQHYQYQYDASENIWYYMVALPSWNLVVLWSVVGTFIRFIIGTEVICIVAMVLRKCCSLVLKQPKTVKRIIKNFSYRLLYKGIITAIRTLSGTQYAYTRDMMTICTRCHESVATAVNTPCGHTFLCWSCAKQYRDEHGNICNSCHEGSTLFKLQQQQMCVICQEHASGHDLFHIQQCGHQVYIIVCTFSHSRLAIVYLVYTPDVRYALHAFTLQLHTTILFTDPN